MSFDQILAKRGIELPNYDKNTGIFYGVIGFNEISPYALDDIFRDAKDLTYESGIKEIKDNVDTYIEYEDLKGLFEYATDTFYYGKYKELYRNAKSYDWYKNDIQQIKEVLSLYKSKDFDQIKEILEEEFNNTYETDEPDILYKSEGYEIINGNSFTLMVIKSPFYTYAPGCSPCYPCAGNLGDIREDCEYNKKTYCLDPSFYEDESKPKYKIYAVKSDLTDSNR